MPNSNLGTITWSGSLRPNVKILAPRIRTAVGIYLNYQTPKVQDYMRGNAPWTDQTGNARNGLFAKYSSIEEGKQAIVVYHTMPYGIWLEVRWAGKYAIIHPTITKEGARVFAGLHGLLDRMVGV